METNVSGYILFYSEMASNGHYKRLSTLDTTATISGLKPNTDYNFRVLAFNENGNGISSPVKSASTKESGMS